jgi:hypothetical protein
VSGQGEATSARRRSGRTVRGLRMTALGVVLAAVAWLLVSSVVRPLRTTCDPSLSPGSCMESVTAALDRGLERPHGLLVAAHVAPGPDAGPGRLGHRATVTFDILGAPGPVSVALYLDMGGHWGGVVDRDRTEVMMVPFIQSLLVLALGLGIVGLGRAVADRHFHRANENRKGADPWNAPT